MNHQEVQKCLRNPHHLLNYSEQDRDNTFHMIKIIKEKPLALQYMSNRLKNDLDFVKIAVNKDMFALQYASEEIQNNRELIKELLENKIIALRCVKENFRADKELVSIGLNNDIMQIEYASLDLRDDEEFIIPLLLKKPMIDSYSFKYLSERLKNKKDTVLNIVSNKGCTLGFMSDDMKCDIDVVCAAVSKSGRALEDAHPKFYTNKDILKLAVKENASIVKVINYRPFSKEFVLELAALNGDIIRYMPENFQKDKDIALIAVQNYKQYLLNPIATYFSNDKDVIMAGCTVNINYLRYASEQLCADKEVILHAIKHNHKALIHAAPHLKTDRHFIFEAVKIHPHAIQYASDELIQEVGSNNPVEYFTAYFLKQDLEQQIPYIGSNQKRAKI